MRSHSVDQAMRAVEAGSFVAVSPYCSTPTTLLAGLARLAWSMPDLVLAAGLLLGNSPYYDAVLTGRLAFRTWHVSAEDRRLAEANVLEYVPVRARDVAAYLQQRADVALVRVTPPDRQGNCSLGPSASYTKALLNSARIRIAEIDDEMPRTFGRDVTYPYGSFDHVVDADTPTSTYVPALPSAQSAAVAARVRPLIDDGVTLQLGIGAVPEAIARALGTSSATGLRLVGMLGDAMVDLVERGRVSHEPRAIEAVELLGSRRIFDFARERSHVHMLSSQTMHDPAWLARQHRLVSICSALEVDLTGQVASEEVSGRTIAGVGGSADFFEGANLSAGGVRVVALPSVTASGESRVKAELGRGTPVTLPRHSVDYIVTEHGVAYLAGSSVRERAEAMLAVASPEHRDGLSAEWANRLASKEE
jgi:4-hydroxybutyrate CoA-transferase